MPFRRTTYDWTGIIRRARQAADAGATVGVLAHADVPVRAVEIVRDRAHPALRRPDGHLVSEMHNVHETEDGTIRGDMFCRWISTTEKESA